jgi:hypothetical protein
MRYSKLSPPVYKIYFSQALDDISSANNCKKDEDGESSSRVPNKVTRRIMRILI